MVARMRRDASWRLDFPSRGGASSPRPRLGKLRSGPDREAPDVASPFANVPFTLTRPQAAIGRADALLASFSFDIPSPADRVAAAHAYTHPALMSLLNESRLCPRSALRWPAARRGRNASPPGWAVLRTGQPKTTYRLARDLPESL
jgi:hypothetical protein